MEDDTLWTLMIIIGPAALLVLMIWLVVRGRSNRSTRRTEQATREEYADEERRRREGTDNL